MIRETTPKKKLIDMSLEEFDRLYPPIHKGPVLEMRNLIPGLLIDWPFGA